MSNPYIQLLALLPARPLLVGTVIAFEGGVATIQMPGGGIAQARGDTAVDATVFFRDGAVEGSAPSLPVVEITV